MTIPIVVVPGRLSGNGGEQMMTMVIGFKANVLTMRWQYSAWSTIPIVIVPGHLSGNGGEQMMTMMLGFKANVLAMGRRYKA